MSREITIKLTLKEVKAVISAFDAEIGLSQKWADMYVGHPRADVFRDQGTLTRALQAKFIRAAGKTGGGA